MFQLLRQYPQLLIFGILAAAFSGPGQTFLVSLFIPGMRETFQYSQTEISSLYATATLCSALILPLIGRLLDRTHLMKFTLVVGIMLAGGCFLLSQSLGWVTIFLGFFLVRNMGQGSLVLLTSTTMARVFGAARGKALGIANLGYPLSEAVFPLLVATWILHYGWRSGWILLAVLTLFFFSPAVLFLLRKNPQDQKINERAEEVVRETTHLTLKAVIQDWRFYVLQVPALIPASFITAIFFHQGSLMAWKNWDMKMIAAAFIAFALGRGLCSFVIGPLIDRYTARALFPFYLIPFLIAFVILLQGQHMSWAIFYLLSLGMSVGFGMTLGGALWAELYGTTHLGSIKGLQGSLMVLSTAIAPVVMGVLLDKGVNIASIVWGLILIIVFGMVLAGIACHKSVSNKAK